MKNIVLNEHTVAHIQRYLGQPSHALLITGPPGSGKQYVAEHIASGLLQLADSDTLDTYAYCKYVLPEKDKQTIGIEAVRDLRQFVKLRLPADKPWRIILIPQAGSLSGEAQNALLKLLEEPPQRTVFLLTAATEQSVLPTINSRVQKLAVHLPTQTSLVEYFGARSDGQSDTMQIQQAYRLSGGLPGLMSALLSNSDHPLNSAVQTARKLLQSSQFERLCLVDELSKKKAETQQVLFVLQHMSHAAIAQTAAANPPDADKRIRQWHKIMQAAYDAERAYAVSAQSKLTLTNLMLSM